MTGSKKKLIQYRIERAKETFDDARILIENKKWNSSINRLYYSAYYAISAMLLYSDLNPTTHNGAKSNFSEHFVKTGKIDAQYGKIYSQLFTWRQKGDYDDFFDFDESKVIPYIKPVQELIFFAENYIKA
ncbi:MAG: HEPN domain-containing protein [Bacteroidetes bacterium]|jgi:uncharacterized protein (UPF0332 family)|nr:HEPN domain-containing protein [Bacteroidota bacterium]